MTYRAVLLPLTILLLGCSTPRGFDRGRLAQDLANRAVTTDEDIQTILDRKPQLPRPFRLGVYFQDPAEANRGSLAWDWTPEDKQVLLDAGESLRRRGLISEVAYIGPSFVENEDLRSIRKAAAQHGVDGVLIVGGLGDLDRYNNRWGPCYAAIITTLFVPGTVVESLFVSSAALWDVRNGFLYLSAEADGEAKLEHPAVGIREDVVVDGAKTASLEALAAEVEWRIMRLAEGRGG